MPHPFELPSQTSDAGPDCRGTPRTPEELVSEAEDCLILYRRAKREALQNTPKSAWRQHLQHAMELLDRADDLEFEA